MKSLKSVAAGLAVLAVCALGASAIAGAASNDSSNSSTSANQRQSPPAAPADPSRSVRSDEHLLTGDTASKVKAAAQDKVPGGTIERVETNADGTPYEAHVTKADGSEVIVQIDKDFKVDSVVDGGGPGGAGGPH